jgi:hypothetical protein
MDITEFANEVLRSSNPRAEQSQEESQAFAAANMTAALGAVYAHFMNVYFRGQPWTVGRYAELKGELAKLIMNWCLLCRASGIEPHDVMVDTLAILRIPDDARRHG